MDGFLFFCVSQYNIYTGITQKKDAPPLGSASAIHILVGVILVLKST